MGGYPVQLIVAVSHDFPVCSVPAPARLGSPRICLPVMARLALIKEILRVQADLRIVAIHVIQPYFVMYHSSRFLPAHLAHAAIRGNPVRNIITPGPPPCLGSIKLFLCHTHTPPREQKRTGALDSRFFHYNNSTIRCAILCLFRWRDLKYIEARKQRDFILLHVIYLCLSMIVPFASYLFVFPPFDCARNICNSFFFQ